MRTALAIFAKSAELSPVKTRLAADIGKEKAKVFYALSVKTIEAIVLSATQNDYNIHPHWCVGEAAGVEYPQWQNFPAIWTGDGGLGARLASISEKLFATHDAVIFIGTDSPQLSSGILLSAVGWLRTEQNTHIAGPALDGGFYLFGSSTPVPQKIWEAVEYSTDTTLNDLITRLQNIQCHTHLLESEQDVDTLADLTTLKHTLQNKKPELLPAQVDLLNWLEAENF